LATILLVDFVSGTNSTVSLSKVNTTIPPFGSFINSFPFSATTTSRIVLELFLDSSATSPVYGSGHKDVSAGTHTARISLSIKNILLNTSYYLRVYIVPSQFVSQPSPINFATDRHIVPVFVTIAPSFDVYVFKLTTNITSKCGKTEDHLSQLFDDHPPIPVPKNLSYSARSVGCSHHLDYTTMTVEFVVGSGSTKERLHLVYSIYPSLLPGSSYLTTAAHNASTTIVGDSLYVSGYDYPEREILTSFWQIFGTLLAVIGWMVVWTILLSIAFAIFHSAEVETV